MLNQILLSNALEMSNKLRKFD